MRAPWNTACEFCARANSVFEEDRRQAEEYIAEHEACVLCFVLVGDGHISGAVDSSGRCETCQDREVPA